MLRRLSPVLLLGVLALAACRSSDADTPLGVDQIVSVSTVHDLIEALRERGAHVEDLGRSVTSVITISGRLLRVDGQRVEAYRFPHEAAATAEVRRLTRSLVHGVAPARLYQRDALLVLYAADDPGVATLLDDLLGSPVDPAR